MSFLQTLFSPSPLLRYGDLLLRMLLACLLGAAIGFERSKRFKEAGIRTHIIVCLGAALFMLISKYGFEDLAGILDGSRTSDPGRVAAQVVSGISFLGVGVIFRNGGTVRGLTTAAGLWLTAGIGLAVGAGMFAVAVTATVIATLLQFLMHRYAVGADAYAANRLHFNVKNGFDFNGALEAQLETWKAQVTESKVTRHRDGTTEYDLTVRRREEISYAEMKAFMESREDIISASNSPIR